VSSFQKFLTLNNVQNREQINMSNVDDSLQIILDNILSEYISADKELAYDALNKGNEEEIAEVTSKSAIILLNNLKSRAPAKLEASEGIEKEFEAAVVRTWKTPLDLLDLLLHISFEVASEFNSEFSSENFSKHDYLLLALARQQTNACLVFNEIIHLLKSGFPGGASSLWRSLHEIACVSYFISKHGEDMAKRFLDYEIVESYYQAQAIHEHQQEIGCQLLSEKDFEEIKKELGKIRKLHGSDFVEKKNYPYGWVPRRILKRRSLREIERLVKLGMLRPYYDMVSYNVNWGPEGLMFKLGLMKNSRNGLVPLIGPSNYGLADPGKSAAISLGQVTACLLLAKPTIKRLVIVEAMRNLVDEICDAFCKIQAEFSQDSKS
jgi:hypothetical protein